MIEWRTVSENENYEVSNTGLVRRIAAGKGACPGRVLKPRKNTHGYPQVDLYQHGEHKNQTIHRLVALAFLGEPPTSKHEIAHADGNKLNNHISNLRWATHEENQADMILHGTINRGDRNGGSKLTESDIDEIRLMLAKGHRQKDIAKMFGVSPTSISHIKTGKKWRWLE